MKQVAHHQADLASSAQTFRRSTQDREWSRQEPSDIGSASQRGLIRPGGESINRRGLYVSVAAAACPKLRERIARMRARLSRQELAGDGAARQLRVQLISKRGRHFPMSIFEKSSANFPGVGAKVANCVMLFAYERLRAFPIDVWIERVLRQQYFPRKRKDRAERLRTFSENLFWRTWRLRAAVFVSSCPNDQKRESAVAAPSPPRSETRVAAATVILQGWAICQRPSGEIMFRSLSEEA